MADGAVTTRFCRLVSYLELVQLLLDQRQSVRGLAVKDICRRHSRLFDDSHRTMRLLMWHFRQEGVASCLFQILARIDEVQD